MMLSNTTAAMTAQNQGVSINGLLTLVSVPPDRGVQTGRDDHNALQDAETQ